MVGGMSNAAPRVVYGGVSLVDAGQARRIQPDDSWAARPLARLDAERAHPEALEVREGARTQSGAARGGSTGIEFARPDTRPGPR
jgi:hypothetical protein